jgi:D-alanyl-D-alanine carboxypeptidase (penicillin-binding protein 5/6)
MFIDTTMAPKVDDLLKGMIVQSGNDASVVLAEAVGGSLDAFVGMMNKQAQAWGLKNTQFRNVTGLSEAGHYASARDVATIAAKIITDFPDFYTYYSIRQFTYNRIKQDNRNLLLGRDPTVDGMKTGFTETAGYCLVASAVREMPNGKRRLVSVVLGTASREARAGESQKLLNWGFQFYDSVKLYGRNQPVTQLRVWKGASDMLKAGFTSDLYIALPKGQNDRIKATVESLQPLLAPDRWPLLTEHSRLEIAAVGAGARFGAAVSPVVAVAPGCRPRRCPPELSPSRTSPSAHAASLPA